MSGLAGCAKGSALIESIRVLRSQRARALELLPPELHHYLERRILVSSWYPEPDYMHLLRALRRVLGGVSWERVGAIGARNDLTGIYAKLVRGKSIEDVATMAPALWRNYHDTGRETVTFAKRCARFEIADFAVVDADYCKVVLGYNRELLETAGAVVLRARKVSCTASGDASCVWEYDLAGERDSTPPRD